VRSTARWRAAAGSLVLAVVAGSVGGCYVPPTFPTSDAGLDLAPQEPLPVDALVSPDADAQVLGVDGDADGGGCASVIEMHPDEGANHIPCTSPTSYLTDPPSSGNHYPIWAAYQTYTSPVPWGNLVHCLEHGAVVIVYNCPGGCADEVARAQAWIDALPTDPDCGQNRVVLAPDPTLEVRWAASAWTWTLRADCFDPAAYTQFYNDHYNHGRELVCGGGANTLDTLCPLPPP
jgi:hypothetical protein